MLFELDLIAVAEDFRDGSQDVSNHFNVLFLELLISTVGKHGRELDCKQVEDLQKPALGHWVPALLEILNEFQDRFVELWY